MLTKTSAQLLDSFKRGDTTGQPMAVGSVLEQYTAGAYSVFTVPRGQVLLVTKIVVQADGQASAVSQQNTPAATLNAGITIRDRAGTAQDTALFKTFSRPNNVFTPNTQDWWNAPPGNAVVWDLKYPYCVPSGWEVDSTVAAPDLIGNYAAVYGFLVDEETARSMNFNVSWSATDSKRRQGMTSAQTSQASMIPAITGKHIRLIDVRIRIQAPTGGSTNTVTLQEGTSNRVLWRGANNNPGDLVDIAFTPEWILGVSQPLELALSTANAGSVTVTYEYLDADEVPGDYWWAQATPTLPSPGEASGLPGIQVSTQLTMYFPRTGITRTAVGAGEQPWIEGYSINIQKDTTDAPEQTFVAISTGTTGGTIKFNAPGNTFAAQGNYQVSPVIAACGHDQTIHVVVDDILVAGPESGAVFVDALALDDPTTAASSTPDQATCDIADWSVSAWGRVAGKRYTDPSNRGL